MNIKFKGHQETDREVELSQQELFQLFEIMRKEFVEHITYARFRNCYSPTPTEKNIIDFDLLIIDEAQDLSDLQWNFVRPIDRVL